MRRLALLLVVLGAGLAQVPPPEQVPLLPVPAYAVLAPGFTLPEEVLRLLARASEVRVLLFGGDERAFGPALAALRRVNPRVLVRVHDRYPPPPLGAASYTWVYQPPRNFSLLAVEAGIFYKVVDDAWKVARPLGR